MHLTNEEDRILKGEEGDGSQRAMELLVAIGDAFDAKGFIPISRAHAASSGQEGDLFFVEILAKGNARCKVLTTTNPVADFDYFQNLININEEHEEASIAWKVKYYYKRIGAVMSQSCIPYLAENIPEYGEHVAFSESSATPYVNSVIGAFSNRESIQSALAAGIIGKTPEYGLHFAENRKGTALVKVECDLRDGFDYSLLGQYIGKQVGNGIPVFSGIKGLPSTDQFINLCAMMNVTGAIGMFHIPGITVGTKTVEDAFDGHRPKEIITVTNDELKRIEDSLQTGKREIDTVILGCPHYNLVQIRKVADLLRGKKLKPDVSFWVNTSATTKVLADRGGFVRDIESAGGRVIVDTCIDMFCWNNLRGKTGMTDSPKCAYYRRFGDVRVGSVDDCVAAATN